MPGELTDRKLRAIRRSWWTGGTCGVVALVASWWLLLAQPSVAARQAILQQLADLDAQSADEHSAWDRWSEVAAEMTRLQQIEEEQRSRVPQQSDEAAFLQWASMTADTCGLALTDFRPAGRTQQGSDEYEGRELTLTAAGGYESVCQFLDHLRTCPRMNRVTSFEISPKDPARANYTLTIRIMLFSEPPRTPAPNSTAG